MFGIGLVTIVPIFIIILIIIFNSKSMEKGKFHLIKNIYLYLVSFVALMMAVTALYSLIDTGLRTWVLTEANNNYYEKPRVERMIMDEEGERVQMTEEQIQVEDERLEKQREQNRVSDLQRDLARNISILVIALPLFAYHWSLVRKKERE